MIRGYDSGVWFGVWFAGMIRGAENLHISNDTRFGGSVSRITSHRLLLRRVTCVLWGVSHMTQHRLYLQCSLVNIWLSSSFETSRRFLRGAFSLGKRNGIRQGLAASHVNSHWLVNLRRIVPEKTQWKWTRGMWQDSCDAHFLCKKTRNVGAVGRESYQFTVTLNARRVLLEKTHGIWKGFRDARFSWKKIRNPGAVGRGLYEFTWIYNHKERKTHVTWENTRNLGGLVQRTFFIEK